MAPENIKNIEMDYARKIQKNMKKWEETHLTKMLKELKDTKIKISEYNIPRIIEQTSFKTKSKEHPNQCPYYKTEQPCHPEIEDLNCFLCSCPKYNTDHLIEKKNQIQIGKCNLEKGLTQKGKYHYAKEIPNVGVWDCSDCSEFHTPHYVRDSIHRNLKLLKELQDKV